MTSILLTGGTGELGTLITEKLRSSQYDVVVAGRNTKPSFSLGYLDRSILDGIDIVIHAAYDFSCRNFESSRSLNVDGTKRIIDATRAKGIKFIFLSSDSVVTSPNSIYGRSKLEIENYLKSISYGQIIRIGIIAGNSPLGPFSKIYQIAKKTRVVIIPSPDKKIYLHTNIDQVFTTIDQLIKLPPTPVGVRYPSKSLNRESLNKIYRLNYGNRYLFLPVSIKLIKVLVKFASIIHLKIGIRSDSLEINDGVASKDEDVLPFIQ